jgi:invasion protein IalB
MTACQVGTGTVVADGAINVPATFDLVAPPAAGDVAGLQLLLDGTAAGAPAALILRPTGDPNGVGLDDVFTNIPDTFDGLTIQVTSLDAVFDNLTYPSTCPSTPASFQLTADSYQNSTPVTASAPLTVTGCSSEAYSPRTAVTATESAGDSGTALTTTITQTAGQATSSSIVFYYPIASLYYNIGNANHLLCASVTSGTCTAVGTATAVSPLYPTALTAQVYLTGALDSPSLTLVFPSPFPITVTGKITLSTNLVDFTNIPDIQLTSLSVALTGGSSSLYSATCSPASGTVDSRLTNASDTHLYQPSAAFTVAGCTTPAAPTGTVAPSITLNESQGNTAGKAFNMGLDLSFAPTGTASVKDLTLILPPGLLLNTSLDGGACLTQSEGIPACEIGSANEVVDGGALLPAAFYLVAPSASSDLAGLQLVVDKVPVAKAVIAVRGTGNSRGVGESLAFSAVPDTYLGIPIQVDGFDGTLYSMHYPSSCPATAATVQLSANSYASSTLVSTTTPLTVTGCSTAAYSPVLTVSAIKDSGDSGAAVTSTITQAANQVDSSAITLALPATVLTPNAAGLAAGNVLCANPASGTCTPVGTASATSPVYATAITGKVYLTGSSLLAASLAVVFPPPTPITITGPVNLATNSVAFTAVPDIPVSNFTINLNGGAASVFNATCSPATGTADGTFKSQNGDKTATSNSTFTVAGCGGEG